MILVIYLFLVCLSLVLSHLVRDSNGQVTVDGTTPIKRCGTSDLSEEDRALADQKLAPYLSPSLRGTEADAAAISVPVYFHVITDSGGNGDVTDAQLSTQIQVLNEAHKNTSFVFSLRGVDRTANDSWFNMEQNSKEELAAKIALKQGGNSMLNVYTVQLTSDVLAWSTFPVVTLFEPERDGIVLSYRTLPGGDLEPYNLGDTLVHEGGHWLGLLHTFFQDGICKPGSAVTGDFISDTPAERIPAYGCPIGRDTCVGSDFAGLDPVTNFMDYSDDQCMTHFTSQQASRMRANWRAFRDGGDT